MIIPTYRKNYNPFSEITYYWTVFSNYTFPEILFENVLEENNQDLSLEDKFKYFNWNKHNFKDSDWGKFLIAYKFLIIWSINSLYSEGFLLTNNECFSYLMNKILFY